MTPGVQFGIDGPIMSGTWTNPKTGHTFTVRDTFFEDNELVVLTTDGQRLSYTMIQDYIQATNKPNETVQAPELKAPQHILDEVSIPVSHSDPIGFPGTPAPAVEDPEVLMISRVLGKHSTPVIKFDFQWTKQPTKQLETLIDILGVDPSQIVDYYINHLSIDEFREDLKKQFETYIENILNPPIPKGPIKRTTTKKTTTKTTNGRS